jgi:hypothetical protein
MMVLSNRAPASFRRRAYTSMYAVVLPFCFNPGPFFPRIREKFFKIPRFRQKFCARLFFSMRVFVFICFPDTGKNMPGFNLKKPLMAA